MRRWVRRLARAIGIAAITLLALVVLLALVPAWTPAIEGERAIAELSTVMLGGIEQHLLIRGRDRSKPVLLYLHGGPGGAFIPFARLFSRRLEDHFVVVHWDQRGAGKSCASGAPAESFTNEQFLSDTSELIDWLRRRFAVEKLYLVGHSWGSELGIATAQRRPEVLHAYVGIGQVVNMPRNEEISYRFVVERAQAEGNQEALSELQGVAPPYRGMDDLGIQRRWLSHYHGDVYGGGGFLRFLLRAALSPEYTLLERARYVPCMMDSVDRLWPELVKFDAPVQVPRLEIPVFFFTGHHDYNTPFELVEEYAAALEAPHVEIVWFEESAHSPPLEEPERFADLLVERVLGRQP
jgi:pimeloyl-ACP methyl ester carboxylesterase